GGGAGGGGGGGGPVKGIGGEEGFTSMANPSQEAHPRGSVIIVSATQRENHVSAPALQKRAPAQQEPVAALQPRQPAGAGEDPPGHRQQLKPAQLQRRETAPQLAHLTAGEWPLIGGVALARVRQAAAGPAQQRVLAPR